MFGLFGSKKKCKKCRDELAKDAGADGLCATCAAQSVSAAFAWREARVAAFLRGDMAVFADAPENRAERNARLGAAFLVGAKEVASLVPAGRAVKRGLQVVEFATNHGERMQELMGPEMKEALEVAKVLREQASGGEEDGGAAGDVGLGIHYAMVKNAQRCAEDPDALTRAYEVAGCENACAGAGAAGGADDRVAADDALDHALRLAPFALRMAYEPSAPAAQRMAHSLPGEYDVVLAEGFPGTGLPEDGGAGEEKDLGSAAPPPPRRGGRGHYGALLVASRSEQRAVLVIRGSQNPMPHGGQPADRRSGVRDWVTNFDAFTTLTGSAAAEESRDLDVHGGVHQRAKEVHRDLGGALVQLASAGYTVELSGHSLGGGVAAMLLHLQRLDRRSLAGAAVEAKHCVAFAPPACVDPLLAKELQRGGGGGDGSVLSVLLGDDVVPRTCARNLTLAVAKVGDSKHWRAAYQADVDAAKEYVRNFGAPAVRPDGVSGAASAAKTTPSGTAAPAPAGESCGGSGMSVAVLAAKAKAKAADYSHLETEYPALFPPGDILHLHRQRGVCRAVLVPAPIGQHGDGVIAELCEIRFSRRMVADHASDAYWSALCDANAARQPGVRQPPAWQQVLAPSAQLCSNCDAPCDWAAQVPSLGVKQMKHCVACGFVACASCAQRREAVPQLGVHTPSTVCDKCFWGRRHLE